LFVTVARGISSADLTPAIEASGPHDFAVRKLALSSAAQLASIASLPYVRDDRETPLCVGRDDERGRSDLGEKGTEIFLQKGLDDPNQLERKGEFSLCRHSGAMRSIEPQMRNCTSGNLEIPDLVLRTIPE
jgi:hypothetical protein